MTAGDRIFSLKHQVWGIAKAIVPEADLPILFVQDDFEYNWWGNASQFETEAEYEARTEAERVSIQQARDDNASKKRIDEHRKELVTLLVRFVSGVNSRETLRSTFQTRYVCPLCSEALLVPRSPTETEPAVNVMKAMPHKVDCDWFRAYELLAGLEVL